MIDSFPIKTAKNGAVFGSLNGKAPHGARQFHRVYLPLFNVYDSQRVNANVWVISEVALRIHSTLFAMERL